MCGRFVRKGQPKKITEFLGVKDGEENWTERFNVAPSATIPIVTSNLSDRHMIPAVWGFTSSGRGPLFNTRAKTVATLSSFPDACINLGSDPPPRETRAHLGSNGLN